MIVCISTSDRCFLWFWDHKVSAAVVSLSPESFRCLHPPYDSEYEVRLERYFYNGSPAYYVYAGEYIVGNVPKEFVPHLEENIDRRYVVDYFHAYGGGQGKNFGAEMKIKYID